MFALQNTTKKALISWLWLIVLTFLSAYLDRFIGYGWIVVCTALFVVFLKGQQIIDIFMELKHAPRFWRMLLLSYVLLIPLILTLIYLI